MSEVEKLNHEIQILKLKLEVANLRIAAAQPELFEFPKVSLNANNDGYKITYTEKY